MLTQRLGSSTQLNEKFVDSLIEKIRENPGSVDEIWLATQYGFPKMETHRANAEKLAGIAEKFRRVGVRVSLQLSNSIGHGEYMSAQDCTGLIYEGSPAEHLVGHDGTVAGYCFCWNGPHMRSYIKEELKAYVSAVKPYCVWVDDDLRASNHAPVRFGCFCPDCMKRFNEKYGSGFTREELVQEISFGKDRIWRERHVQFLRDSLGDFTYDIGTAIHEACPDTRMGYQYCANGGYTGLGYDFIFSAMYRATGHKPCSRPGGGSYDDFNPQTFVDKAELLDYQNYMLPDYVEDIRPEIESLPDIVYGKSIGGTCFETSYYLASGANAMSYAILMNDYEPMEWHGKMLAAFARHRGFWEKLSATSRGTAQTGLALAFPKTGYMRETKDVLGYSAEYFRDAYPLRFTGVPVAFSDDRTLTSFLSLGNAQSMTDEEICDLLHRPVVTVGAVIAYLQERGVKFPCTVKPIHTLRLHEVYTDHPVNGKVPVDACRRWGGQFCCDDGYALYGEGDGFEPLALYASESEVVPADTASSAIVKTECGAKWAVFGFDFPQRKVSSARVAQLLETCAYISGHRFAAELLTPIQGILQPRVNREGKTDRVCFTNCTVGDSGELTFAIRNPAGTKFTFMSQYENPCILQAVETAEGEYRVTVPGLHGWSVGAVFCENDE